MAKEKRQVTDPNGVLLNGKRYPAGTPVDELEGATTAHIKIWTRFGQIADAKSAKEEKGGAGE
jgi:hypothetical protein